MAETNYDVRAQLLIEAKRAHGEIRKVGSEVRELGESLSGASEHARGMMDHLLSLGAAYLGLHAIGHMFKHLSVEAVTYAGNLEKTKLGLQSVISAVENTSWDQAGKKTELAFKKIRDMALELPVTSEQMFGIFQGIVGPIEAAGFSMNKVLDITRQTTLAASALNVDFTEAGRDITMMARGAAGMHVKLFSLLHATGAIKEDAQAFNALSSHDRIEKLSAALGKFSSNGKAFALSWAGVTTSFQDIVENFRTSAFSPIMKRIAENLNKFNNYMLDHRKAIEAFMTTVGNNVATRLNNLFIKAQEGFKWVVANWDTIVSRVDHVVEKVKEMIPHLIKAAAIWQGVSVGRAIAGAGVSGVGKAIEIAGTLGTMGAGFGATRTAGMAAQAATAAAQLGPAQLAGVFGQMGGASGAVGTTGVFGMMGGATGGGGAAVGAAEGAAMAGGVALAPVLATVAAALAVLLAVGLAVSEQWKNVSHIFGQEFGQIGQMLIGVGLAIWNTLSPILKIFGSVILASLIVTWEVFSVLLRGFLVVLRPILDILGSITTTIYDALKPAFDWLFGALSKLSDFFKSVFGEVDKMREEKERAKRQRGLEAQEQDHTGEDFKPLFGPSLFTKSDMKRLANPEDLNKANVTINQDFRGSRIQIRQDFKAQQDPDRIVTSMMRDLTRQAESRISSGFAGALTR
jgi:hypothetical protein